MSIEWEKALIQNMTPEIINDYRNRITGLMEEVLVNLEKQQANLTTEEAQFLDLLKPIKDKKGVFENVFKELGILLYLQQIYIEEYEVFIRKSWFESLPIPRDSKIDLKKESKIHLLPLDDSEIPL